MSVFFFMRTHENVFFIFFPEVTEELQVLYFTNKFHQNELIFA